jgi:threonyl-tRNA synthetase
VCRRDSFSGRGPLWLAPGQVRILPISDDELGYAHRLKNDLEDEEFRVDIEDRSWTLGRKIREAQTDRVPYMVIVGDDEVEAGTISVRDRKEREQQDVEPDAFVDHLVDEREDKREAPDFLA